MSCMRRVMPCNRPTWITIMILARSATLALAILLLLVPTLRAETSCDSPADPVDLAIEEVHLRETDDGKAVVYALSNRGPLRSTSFAVALLADGADIGVERSYPRGLAAGRQIRWELEVPATVSLETQQLAVEVRTASDTSAAGPGYADHCATNNRLQVPASGSLA